MKFLSREIGVLHNATCFSEPIPHGELPRSSMPVMELAAAQDEV